MALSPKLSDVAINAAADVVCSLLNGGYLRLYSGSQPATASTAITSQMQLAELRFSSKAFAPAAGGVAAANAIAPDKAAAAVGMAQWFRAFKSDGLTSVFDGSVGINNPAAKPPQLYNVALKNNSIVRDAEIRIDSFSYRQPDK